MCWCATSIVGIGTLWFSASCRMCLASQGAFKAAQVYQTCWWMYDRATLTHLASVIPPPRLKPPFESKRFSVILFAYRRRAGDLCWSLMSSMSLADPTPACSERVKHSDRSSMNPSSSAFPTSLEESACVPIPKMACADFFQKSANGRLKPGPT